MSAFENWTTPLPLYVSRPTADGTTASISFPVWFALLVAVLVMLNAALWGVVGIVAAVGVLF